MRLIQTALTTTAVMALMSGAALAQTETPIPVPTPVPAPTLTPVPAQTVSCGGIGTNGQWIGGTPEASDIAASAGPLILTGLPIPQGGNAVTFFSLSATGDVRLEAQPTPGGDPVIEIYNEAGGLVVSDDDSGGNYASRAETELAPGNYCMLTRGFGGGGLTADVQVGRLEHDPITAGLSGGFFGGGFGDPYFVGVDPCMPETAATPLGNGSLDTVLFAGGASAVNTITGVPYYRFTLDAPQALSIRAENPSADPYIYIFDGQGNLLAENDDYESLNSRIDFTAPLEAGTYCIGMRSLSDPNLPVTVSVVGYDAAAALRELYAVGDAAPPMDGSYPITDLGVLPGRSVRDIQISGRNATWFAFEVTQRGALVIDAVEVTDSDPLLILYDDLGNEIAYNDDFGGSLNSQIVARVQAGRYLLAVRQYSDSYQGIIRLATENYIPAP